MNRVTLRRINPTLKLALLLAVIALLNLAPEKGDCCKNEEEGDGGPNLFYICVEGNPEEHGAVAQAGATCTFRFKQTNCGDPNSTFLLPRPWDILPGAGMTLLNQSASGTELEVTVKLTDHPELYDSFTCLEAAGHLASMLYVKAGRSGIGTLLGGELKTRDAFATVDIRPAPGTDIPWSRSDSRTAPLGPRIQVTPAIPFFHEVNKTNTSSLGIGNRGTENLDISSITLEEAGEKWFQFSPGSSVPPYWIAPGRSHSVSISCKPTYGGQKTATLTITSNDPKFHTVTLSVKATGYAP